MRVARIFCSLLFEVAAIRPAEVFNKFAEYSVAGSMVTFEVYDIPSLVREAYGLEFDQLVLSPGLRIAPGVFTIQAKAPGTEAPTRRQAQEMLQELLATRFQLKLHMESREIPAYSLLPGKNGVKLRESKPDAATKSSVINSGHLEGDRPVEGRTEVLKDTHVTMQEFARDLRYFVGRAVVDKTGLAGTYDVTLEATPFRLIGGNQPDDISVFSAIQSLGLRLEADRVAMPVVVVDAVGLPTDN
jgi:uncharacterized protein (TIGR03435 family)